MLSVLHWVVLGVGLPFVMVGIVTITTEGGTSFSISYTRVKSMPSTCTNSALM